MSVVFFLLASYLLGAFPTSYLAGRFHGTNLRQVGSGNLGATNAYRRFGFPTAGLVLTVDIVKGFVPAWFFPLWDGSASPHLALAYAFLAIAGHIWSAFTRFAGGKGVATAAGALLALVPLAVLVASLAWAGLLLCTRMASVASLAAAVLVPLVAYAAAAPPSTVLFAVAIAVLLWSTHRGNLLRLLRREELRLSAVRRSADDGEEG